MKLDGADDCDNLESPEDVPNKNIRHTHTATGSGHTSKPLSWFELTFQGNKHDEMNNVIMEDVTHGEMECHSNMTGVVFKTTEHC